MEADGGNVLPLQEDEKEGWALVRKLSTGESCSGGPFVRLRSRQSPDDSEQAEGGSRLRQVFVEIHYGPPHVSMRMVFAYKCLTHSCWHKICSSHVVETSEQRNDRTLLFVGSASMMCPLDTAVTADSLAQQLHVSGPKNGMQATRERRVGPKKVMALFAESMPAPCVVRLRTSLPSH